MDLDGSWGALWALKWLAFDGFPRLLLSVLTPQTMISNKESRERMEESHRLLVRRLVSENQALADEVRLE